MLPLPPPIPSQSSLSQMQALASGAGVSLQHELQVGRGSRGGQVEQVDVAVVVGFICFHYPWDSSKARVLNFVTEWGTQVTSGAGRRIRTSDPRLMR